MLAASTSKSAAWPALPLEAWADTCATLHRWTQVIGKVRLALSPAVNHGWHVTLYMTARGLTTFPIPHGERIFEIDFDFVDHRLSIRSSDGREASFALRPMSVASFYARVSQELEHLDLALRISRRVCEVPDAIPLDEDEMHCAYDAEYAHRYWQVLTQADRVFKRFRGAFLGKCSPVHYFWGAPDLAVTRFSGRIAPVHPGGIPNLPDRVVREAYSHEVSSCGFWPGGGSAPYPAFYAYAYPEPAGFSSAPVRPEAAFYSDDLKEFILPYDAVREAASPDDTLLDFLQTTYEAAASLGQWDRALLERTATR
ncbi:MAG TPA: DUF5996 family protein [Burkholderiales bacterium]